MERCMPFFRTAHEGVVDPGTIEGNEDMVMNWVIVRILIVNGDSTVEASYGISVPVAMKEA